MFIWTFLLRITHTLISQSIADSSWITLYTGVPLATEPGISLIILTPMKILQRNLNRSKFVVWEMKKNVSVVCVCSAPNCCDTEQRSASQPGSVASGTHCIYIHIHTHWYLYIHTHVYVYTQCTPINIQNPTHWNLICRSNGAPPPVSSPSSVLPPPSYHCALNPTKKSSTFPSETSFV